MRPFGARGGARPVLIAAAALIFPASPAPAQQLSAEISGWDASHIPLAEQREMGGQPSGPDMSRRAGDTRIEYRVLGGLVREVAIQRFNCGEATNDTGGVAFSDRIYHVGGEVQLAEAVRTKISELDSSYDEYCPARPAELAGALSGMEAALAQVELWAAADPLPPIEAWERQAGDVRRYEPPVTITWNSIYEGPTLQVSLESCGDNYFSEQANIEASPDPARLGALAQEALASLLRRAQAQCALHPTQAARLLIGFGDAVSEAESQLAALEETQPAFGE